MKFSDIPYYNDPQDFINGNVKYPCNTQFMIYNPLEHRYYLTEQALEQYGIDVDRKYVSDSPNKRDEFIKKVSNKVYEYIEYVGGWKRYQILLYRIAKGYCRGYDPYSVRKQFQDALIYEAQWLIENGDSAKFSKQNIEKGIIEEKAPEETWMDTSDIATGVKRIVEILGLNKWFSIGQQVVLNDEY